jgi:hypothetical protein
MTQRRKGLTTVIIGGPYIINRRWGGEAPMESGKQQSDDGVHQRMVGRWRFGPNPTTGKVCHCSKLVRWSCRRAGKAAVHSGCEGGAWKETGKEGAQAVSNGWRRSVADEKGGGAVRCAMCRKRRRGSGTHDAKETGGRPGSRVPHEGGSRLLGRRRPVILGLAQNIGLFFDFYF